jgi:hypothetical protein
MVISDIAGLLLLTVIIALMGTILVAWELGGGLGHLVRARPVVSRLLAAGHKIVAIVRDLARMELVFGDLAGSMPGRDACDGASGVSCRAPQAAGAIEYCQAPVKLSRGPDPIDPVRLGADSLCRAAGGP